MLDVGIGSMSFDVNRYWRDRGKGYRFESRLESPFYREQEDFVIETLRGLGPHQSILEVGCGFGRITRRLEADYVAGCDISMDQVQAARQSCLKSHFFLSDMLSAVSPSRKWDVILAIEVLLHQPLDVLLAFIRGAVATARHVLHDYDPKATAAAEHCWVHNYPAIYQDIGLNVQRFDCGPHTLLCVNS